MKTKISIVAFVLFLLGAMACRAESDKNYTNRRIEEVEARMTDVNSWQNSEIGKLQKHVATLENSIQSQANTINQLIEQLEHLQNKLGENAEKINKLDTETEKVGKRWVLALWVGIPVVVLLLLGLILLFIPASSRSSNNRQGDNERLKCPRCGWEHDPGDTVCKNPACKTQF